MGRSDQATAPTLSDIGQQLKQPFEHLLSILLAQYASNDPRHKGRPKLLAPWLWALDDALCIALPSSIQNRTELEQWAESHTADALKDFQDHRRVKNMIVVVPLTVSGGLLADDGNKSPYPEFIQACLAPDSMVEHWDEPRLQEMILGLTPLALHYYPEKLPDGEKRLNTIQQQYRQYIREMIKLYAHIQFVGMSVYKEEASASVPIEDIYIPLQIVPEASAEETADTRSNPLELLTPGARHVILGDPGSGKSTLLRFLALAGHHEGLQQKYNAPDDSRLPILILLRRYASALRDRPDLQLLDYAVETAQTDFEMPDLNRAFFEYALYGGKAVVLIDGIDELPDVDVKARVRAQIDDFLITYPGNAVILSSRIIGYDRAIRFDDLGFSHHRVARLALRDMERFVQDWYAARIENRVDRQRHAQDLNRIIGAEENHAIRDLAENPLLLTIICLVHRINAVLPDERVVLYQKCTETLLNTWHAWQFHGEQLRSRNKTERRNRARMETIAYWMHGEISDTPGERRAIVDYAALHEFLVHYIREIEKPRREKPEQLAEVFIRFVRERAGLLIEVGDQQYSFVHLTFQEYLAATHLRKSGEQGGMAVVWNFIQDKCGDSRWHEVIRSSLRTPSGAMQKRHQQCVVNAQNGCRKGDDPTWPILP